LSAVDQKRDEQLLAALKDEVAAFNREEGEAIKLRPFFLVFLI